MVNVCVIMALESEAASIANHNQVIISGLGKINAAIAATKAVLEHRPDVIINIGTAGGITVGTGIYQPRKFVQRDMRCEPLGYALGQTPFDTVPAVIDLGAGLVCSTGDDFVVAHNGLNPACDLVDMEAYAIAKVCQKFDIEFVCGKWVSDQANDSSPKQWQQQVSAGEQEFLRFLAPYGF